MTLRQRFVREEKLRRSIVHRTSGHQTRRGLCLHRASTEETRMRAKQLIVTTLLAAAAAAPSVVAWAAPNGLVETVRQATSTFHDVSAAIAAGYASAGSCVSGPQEGAMGVHFANGALVGDGALDAQRPELLIYEQRGKSLRLLGVEYLVIAEQWHATNAAPPILMGQHFHFVGSPNRYGLPPFYELHVWAWKHNPHGMFTDWNPTVTCDEYTGG
jgi:hypothetical protein